MQFLICLALIRLPGKGRIPQKLRANHRYLTDTGYITIGLSRHISPPKYIFSLFNFAYKL